MGQTSFEFDKIPEVKKDSTPEEKMEEFWGEPISIYSREQAIEDGIMAPVGEVATEKGKITVCFTSNLLAGGGYDTDSERRKWLVNHGLQKLKEKDQEDSETMRLRVLEDPKDPVERGKIYCILDGDGIVLMRPEDY